MKNSEQFSTTQISQKNLPKGIETFTERYGRTPGGWEKCDACNRPALFVDRDSSFSWVCSIECAEFMRLKDA